MEQLNIDKTVLDKNSLINKDFQQFNNVEETSDSNNDISIDQFFEIYENLFYLIPKEGDINSHRYILSRTAQYLDINLDNEIDIDVLVREITELRQELLEANTLLSDINIDTSLLRE